MKQIIIFMNGLLNHWLTRLFKMWINSVTLRNTAVLFHRFTPRLRELSRFWERLLRDRCLNPYRITPIHWLMARHRLWRNHVVSLYWRTRHPLLRFLCLHEAVTLPFVVAIFWPKLIFCNHPFALRRLPRWELCSPRGEVSWSIAAVKPPWRAFIARRRPHSKCIIVLGVFACTWRGLRDLEMQDLRGFPSHNLCSRLEAYVRRNPSIFPVAPPGHPRSLLWDRGLSWGLTWGSDFELEEIDVVSRQASPFLSLPYRAQQACRFG